MRWVLGVVMALALGGAALAKPAETQCVADDGSDFYMLASNGTVVIKWGDDGQWNRAFAKQDGQNLIITQIAPRGVIVIAWHPKSNAAFVVMKNDKTGRQDEFWARCWFK